MIHLTCAEQPRKLHQASPSRRKIKTPHKTRNKKKKDTTLDGFSLNLSVPAITASILRVSDFLQPQNKNPVPTNQFLPH